MGALLTVPELVDRAAQLYGDRRQTGRPETTIRATIFLGYGRAEEERREVVRRLEGRREVVTLARVTVP